MSEWWTYELSDFLLFAPRTYYRLFELYNRAIWPAHILALGAGGAVLVLLRRGDAGAGRAVAAILAACWLWVAWGFHFERYATINWAATWFAAAFAIEAALLAWTGAIRGRLRFGASTPTVRRAGVGMVLFALVVQPLIGPLAGRDWVQAELFGARARPDCGGDARRRAARDGPGALGAPPRSARVVRRDRGDALGDARAGRAGDAARGTRGARALGLAGTVDGASGGEPDWLRSRDVARSRLETGHRDGPTEEGA